MVRRRGGCSRFAGCGAVVWWLLMASMVMLVVAGVGCQWFAGGLVVGGEGVAVVVAVWCE